MSGRRKDSFDERAFTTKKPDISPDFGLWGAGDTEPSVPSVPVASSERGADAAEPKAKTQRARILLELRAHGCVPGSGKYLSRDYIAEQCELTVNAACGRLGPSGKLVIPEKLYTPSCCVPIVAVEDACLSCAGIDVLGYQLTAYGVKVSDALARRAAA